LGRRVATHETYLVWPEKVNLSSQTGGEASDACHSLAVKSLDPDTMQEPFVSDVGSGIVVRHRTSLEWPDKTDENLYRGKEVMLTCKQK
jgi:hypothetical protein